MLDRSCFPVQRVRFYWAIFWVGAPRAMFWSWRERVLMRSHRRRISWCSAPRAEQWRLRFYKQEGYNSTCESRTAQFKELSR